MKIQEFHSKHFLINNEWIHIISDDVIHRNTVDRMINAYNVIFSQYGNVNIVIHISENTDNAEETEKGIYLIDPADIDGYRFHSDCLVTNNIFLDIFKFFGSEDEETPDLFQLLKEWHDIHGLLCVLLDEK